MLTVALETPIENQQLFIVEAGCHSGGPSGSAAGCDGVLTLLQQCGEQRHDFSRRVAERIRRLKAPGCRIDRAVFALGSASSSDSLAARVMIARALVLALREHGGTELELIGPNRCSDALRHEMLAIVDALRPALVGSALNVHVKFGQPAAHDRECTRSVRNRAHRTAA
jgi:hypothetical protein